MYIGTVYSVFKNVHNSFKCMPLRNNLWEEYKVVPLDTRLSGAQPRICSQVDMMQDGVQ